MRETTAEIAVRGLTRIWLERLSDEELAALNNCVYLGWDPRPVMGYEKVKSLFTDMGTNGRPMVSREVKREIHQVALERFRVPEES